MEAKKREREEQHLYLTAKVNLCAEAIYRQSLTQYVGHHR